jgi:hypothetical protein
MHKGGDQGVGQRFSTLFTHLLIILAICTLTEGTIRIIPYTVGKAQF